MTTLESWIIPFTFIPGVGMLVLSTANRLQNVSTLIREIIQSQHHVYEENLEILLQRTRLFHRALVCFYSAVGLLALAALVGSLQLSLDNLGSDVAKLITTVGVVSVIVGTIQLIQESIISSRLLLYCKKTHERILRLKEEQAEHHQ